MFGIGIYEVSYRKYVDGKCVIEDNTKYRKRYFLRSKAIEYARQKSGVTPLEGHANCYYATFNNEGIGNSEAYIITVPIWFDLIKTMCKRKDPLL